MIRVCLCVALVTAFTAACGSGADDPGLGSGGLVNVSSGGAFSTGATAVNAGGVSQAGALSMPSSGGALPGAGASSSGGAAAGGAPATAGSSPVAGASSAGGTAAGGSSGAGGGNTGRGGSSNLGGQDAGGSNAGGFNSGGNSSGGRVATGGQSGSGVTGGAAGGAALPPLDCGAQGWAVENHGPPKNRVNYVILADGYSAETVNTTLVSHINVMLKRRFEHESGQPYARYRNFVNICVMKSVSQTDGIGKGPTAFDGGNGGDRLAAVNSSKVNSYIKANVPASFEIDWKAVVLNQNLWENTGSVLMLWSGAHGDAAGAALHEGGHGFHQLADEYCAKATGSACGQNTNGEGTTGTEYQEVNTTGNPATTGGKWDLWLGSTQKGLNTPDQGATGVQGTFVGSRYVDSGQYRPSANSMMNSLFGNNVNTSFNSVSREQMIFSIWRAVVPIDDTEPPAGEVSDPGHLTVHVIDPAVISVDWTVDGVTTVNAGTTFSTAGLAPGSHIISAKAYDNASNDLVRNRSSKCPPKVTGNYCHGSAWSRSQQTVTWTVKTP